MKQINTAKLCIPVLVYSNIRHQKY